MELQKWSVEDFKEYCHRKVDEFYWVTPSAVVLKSFYISEVEKPDGLTIRMFDFLGSISEKELQVYKQKIIL